MDDEVVDLARVAVREAMGWERRERRRVRRVADSVERVKIRAVLV